jgi:rhodanese-related sulfurtransferase
VPQGLVVGIFPGSDPTEIQNALSGQNVDLTKVTVVSRSRTDPPDDPSGIHFMDVEEAMLSNSFSDDMTKGKGIMGDSGGTSVPGVGGRGPSITEFAHHDRPNYLTAFPIPADEVDNFNGAIDEGRAVIAYPNAGADAANVAAAFKAAGLRNVRSY